MAARYKACRRIKCRSLINCVNGEVCILCAGIVPRTGDGELGSIGANIFVVGAGNGVIRVFHQGRGAVLHFWVRRDLAAGVRLACNSADCGSGDVLRVDLRANTSNSGIAVVAVAHDLVVHGVVPGVLALRDFFAPGAVVQAVPHGAAVGFAHKAQQYLLAAVILQAGLGSGGRGNGGRGEALGFVDLGEKQLPITVAGNGVAIRGGVAVPQRFGKGLAGVGRQGDPGVVVLLGLGGGISVGDRRTGGIGALKPLHLGDGIGCAGINAADEVQLLARFGLLDGSGHAGDRGLGDGDRGGSDAPSREHLNFSLIAICECVLNYFKIANSRLTINYRESDSHEGFFCIALSRGTIIPRSGDRFSSGDGFHIFCCTLKYPRTNDILFSN